MLIGQQGLLSDRKSNAPFPVCRSVWLKATKPKEICIGKAEQYLRIRDVGLRGSPCT